MINDVFKITDGNVNDQATLSQLKDQYNKAKQDIIERFEDAAKLGIALPFFLKCIIFPI